MWKCVNCSAQINDSSKFCWKCGTRNAQRGIPRFASLEELIPEPPKNKERLTVKVAGSIVESILGIIASVVIVQILRMVYGAYGLYLSISFIVAIVLFMVWRVFSPNPRDGKGLGL